MLKSSLRNGAALLMLAGMMMLAACGSTSSNAGNSTTTPTKFSLTSLRLGLIPLDNATTEIANTQAFKNDLQTTLGVPVTLFVGTSYTATIEALASGKIDAALFGPLSYLLANSKYNIQFLCRQLSTNGSETYNSLIVTRPDTSIKTVAGLKGHSFSFVDPASTSGYLIPSYTLKNAGLDPMSDVKGIFSGNHTASITAVVNKKVDAGAVASDTFAAQQAAGLFKASDVVILDKSFDIYQGPIGVPPTMSASDQSFLKAALIGVTNKDDLKQAGLGGFVNGSDHDYDKLRDVAKVLNLDLSKVGG